MCVMHGEFPCLLHVRMAILLCSAPNFMQLGFFLQAVLTIGGQEHVFAAAPESNSIDVVSLPSHGSPSPAAAVGMIRSKLAPQVSIPGFIVQVFIWYPSTQPMRRMATEESMGSWQFHLPKQST